MKKVNIIDLIEEEKKKGKKNKFHFTESEKTLEKIEKEGLVAQIGKNAKGIDEKNKVFYSEGIESLMQTIDVWVRFELERMHLDNCDKEFKQKLKMGAYDETSIEHTIGEIAKLKEFENIKEDIQNVQKQLKAEYDKYALKKFPKTEEEFLKKMYSNQNVEETLGKMYDDFKNRKYLLFDYNPKMSYIDTPKSRFGVPRKDFKGKWMFGKYSDLNNMFSDSWNMYTTEDIVAENISQIVSDKGDNAIDIIQEIYDNSEKHYDYNDLKLLIDYSKEKEKEKQEQEQKFEDKEKENTNIEKDDIRKNAIEEYSKKSTLDKIMDIQIGDEEVWPFDIKNIVKEKLEKNGKLLDKAITLSEIQSRMDMYNYQIGREENEEEKDKLEKKLEEIQKEYNDTKKEKTESKELLKESNFSKFRKSIKEKIKNSIEKFKNKFVDLKNINKREYEKENKKEKNNKEKEEAVEIESEEKNEHKEDIELEKDIYKYDEITKNNIRNIDKYLEKNENINIENEEDLEEKNKEIDRENEIKKDYSNYLDNNNDEREI